MSTEQKRKKKEAGEEPKPKPLDDMSIEELNKELSEFLKKYKEFSDLAVKLAFYKDLFKEIGKKLNQTGYYLEELDKNLEKFINQSKEIAELYIKKVSLIKTKKEFNIQI